MIEDIYIVRYTLDVLKFNNIEYRNRTICMVREAV